MKITKAMILALWGIDDTGFVKDRFFTFSRKVNYETMKKLWDGSFITPYEGELYGKPMTRFKRTQLGEKTLLEKIDKL